MEPRVGDVVLYWGAGEDGDPTAAIVTKVNRGLHGETRETVNLHLLHPLGGTSDVAAVHGPDTDLERHNARARWAWRPERLVDGGE